VRLEIDAIDLLAKEPKQKCRSRCAEGSGGPRFGCPIGGLAACDRIATTPRFYLATAFSLFVWWYLRSQAWDSMMHRFSVALFFAVSAFVFTQIASAADLPTKAPDYRGPPPALSYSWAGSYLGANAGAVWSNTDITWTRGDTGLGIAVTNAATGSLEKSGFTGGGQLGYNFQSGQFVYGFETDINYTDISGSRISHLAPPFVNNMVTTVESKWLGTVRGRLGAAFDRTLIYVTGGLAVANVKYSDSIGTTNIETNSSDTPRAGWTVGGGIEWAFAGPWSVKAEYLYVDLGNETYHGLSSSIGFTNVTLDHRLRENIARAGINYRFGGF
jgi:outer membrane immunogenic protein